MAETTSLEGHDLVENQDKGITFQEIFPPIWTERKRILLISLGVAVLTLIVNFLLPNYYKATATLLPETEKSKLSALGQFADIAQIAGVNIPGSEIARLYPVILSSETILQNVIERTYQSKRFSSPVNLIQYFELDEDSPEKNLDKGLKQMRELLSTGYDNRTSIVTVSLEMREPQLAADVLNALISELDSFMRSKRISNATEQRKWVEIRLKEVEQELRNSEEELKNFREKNRQVSGSPQLLLEQERLGRAVQINSTVFIELKRQYEIAKIEEIKNIPIVNILDPARAPTRKDRPKQATNTVLMFFLSIVGSGGYFFVQRKYSGRISAFLRKLKGGGS